MPSYHDARFTLRRPSLRSFLLNFARAVVLSSNCFRAEAVTDISKGEDGRKIIIQTLQDTVRNVQISEEEALADTTLRSQIINLGVITGIELLTGPYIFRRNNGQALDNSSMWALIFT